MNTMTSTITKTTTNTKLAVATAFLAASAAFAMIPASTGSTRLQGCVDPDASTSSTYGESQLFVKSTTTYNTGSKVDQCYTVLSTGKTFLGEGVCKEGNFGTWRKDCAELNVGNTGANYQCVQGACVNVPVTSPSSTPTTTPIVYAPTNLVASLSCFSATTTQVILNWMDNTTNETGFEIKKAEVIRGNVGANITTFADVLYGTYTPSAVLTYSVGAKTSETTYYSNPVSVTLPATFPCASSTPTTTANLTVSPKGLTVPAAAGSNSSVTVSSNVTWAVSDNQTWLTVLPSNGSNNGTLAISYTTNTVASSRSGVVTVIGGGITQTVTVTQMAASSTPTVSTTLSVSPTAFSTAALTGSRNVSVSSNVSWAVTENYDWLSVSPVSGLNNGSFAISYTANTLTTSRTGVVSVTGGGITRAISVTQNAASSTPTTTPTTTLSVSPTYLTVPYTAGSDSSTTVASNVTWTITDNQD